MEVTAAVAVGKGRPFELQRLQLDDPRPDEVLVRILGVGVCHTDLVFKEGQVIAPPVVFGHEGAGVVEQVGPAVTRFAPGDRVAITFRSCGECRNCGRGDPAYCLSMPRLNYSGIRTDGSKSLKGEGGAVAGNFFGQSSFATHALTYERNLVKVPEGLPLELMGPLGCAVQTGAGAIMRSLACEAGSSLVIAGGGPVGLSAVMGAKIQKCGTIIVVEPQGPRRALALEYGATHVIDPATAGDLGAAIRAIAPEGVGYAFDTTGVAGVHAAIMRALAPKGVLGLVGVASSGTPLPSDVGSVVACGYTIKGIIEGDSEPDVFLPELFERHARGELPFERMITTYPFSQINEAIAAQHRGECIKVVLLMDA